MRSSDGARGAVLGPRIGVGEALENDRDRLGRGLEAARRDEEERKGAEAHAALESITAARPPLERARISGPPARQGRGGVHPQFPGSWAIVRRSDADE